MTSIRRGPYHQHRYGFSGSHGFHGTTNPRVMLLVKWSIVGIFLVLVSIVYLANNLPDDSLDHHNHHRRNSNRNPLQSVVRPKRFRLKRRRKRQPDWSSSSSYSHIDGHRIAILLPFVGQGPQDIPPYLNVFCFGAAAAAPIADFLLIHNGVLQPEALDCPPNVIFINLESTLAMADHLVRVVDHKHLEKEEADPVGGSASANSKSDSSSQDNLLHQKKTTFDRHRLVQLVARHLQVYPYCLVEFKPALGFIFAEYLTKSNNVYTHWGYSDLDMLFGDLGQWITPDELNDFDIFTYGFGDQERLYLRGQFTVHKNEPETINQLWRACDYLVNLDDRLAKVISGEEKYRFESAEGCYSAMIFQRNDIKVKFATKAWTDISRYDTAYSHGIYLTRGRQHQNSKMVLSKVSATDVEHAAANSTTEGLGYSNSLQVTVGERIPLALPDHPSAKCMYWVQQKYQRHLCLQEHVNPNETLSWIDGTLYRQKHVDLNHVRRKGEQDNNNENDISMISGPFFHFQEWKRYYRPSQLAAMHYSSPVTKFILVKEGAIPIVDRKKRGDRGVGSEEKSEDDGYGGGGGSSVVDDDALAAKIAAVAVSPLLKKPAKRFWSRRRHKSAMAAYPLSVLPTRTYCLVSGPRKIPPQPPSPECYQMTSWRDEKHVEILSTASDWQGLTDTQTDVTLVLTLQVTAGRGRDKKALSDTIELVITNIERWQGQPCVVVIYIAGVTDDALVFLRNRFQSDLSFESSLVALIFQEETGIVSRKALLNMAMDAVPSRWYMVGMELERGLILSRDTVVLAHRASAAAAAQGTTGSVFVLPQFAVNGDDTRIGVRDLSILQDKGNLKRLVDVERDTCDDEDLVVHLDELDDIWWDQVDALLERNKEPAGKNYEGFYAKRAEALVNMEVSILELLTDEKHLKMFALDQSPIMLMDNVGPQQGMRTDELVREVEELGGRRCYNGLRMSQLAALGYHFDVLGGAFALSTSETRRSSAWNLDDENTTPGASRCDGCFMFAEEHEDILENIVKAEIARPGKAAVLWSEAAEE